MEKELKKIIKQIRTEFNIGNDTTDNDILKSLDQLIKTNSAEL